NTSHRMFRPLVYGNCQSVIGRSRNGRQEKQLPEVWIFSSEGKRGSRETRIRAVERIQSISRKICHGGCMLRGSRAIRASSGEYGGRDAGCIAIRKSCRYCGLRQCWIEVAN